MSCVTSSGPGRWRVRMFWASGASSHSGPLSSASKLLAPWPPTATTCFRCGRLGCRSVTIFSKSKPRKVLGVIITLASPCWSMNDSSRSRKMCISGFITAPMREQAR